MEQHDDLALTRILEALDSSIQAAIANPASAGIDSLQRAEELCRGLTFNETPVLSHERTLGKTVAGQLSQRTSHRRVELLWEIRGRLGRLKMLLDAAAEFYRGLASSPSAGMDYDVQGEWTGRTGGSLLQLDC